MEGQEIKGDIAKTAEQIAQEEDDAREMAERLGYPFIDMDDFQPDHQLFSKVPGEAWFEMHYLTQVLCAFAVVFAVMVVITFYRQWATYGVPVGP